MRDKRAPSGFKNLPAAADRMSGSNPGPEAIAIARIDEQCPHCEASVVNGGFRLGDKGECGECLNCGWTFCLESAL